MLVNPPGASTANRGVSDPRMSPLVFASRDKINPLPPTRTYRAHPHRGMLSDREPRRRRSSRWAVRTPNARVSPEPRTPSAPSDSRPCSDGRERGGFFGLMPAHGRWRCCHRRAGLRQVPVDRIEGGVDRRLRRGDRFLAATTGLVELAAPATPSTPSCRSAD